MNAKNLLLIITVAVASAGATWLALRHDHAAAKPAAKADGREILYYQSAMHPWIKSDKPGRCTICGMELSPVYKGDKGFDTQPGTVVLSSNVVQVVDVQTDEIKRQPLTRTLRVAGTIDDDDTRHRILSSYVDGRIDKLMVNYVGAEVQAGQLLATLYSPEFLAAEREYTALAKAAPKAVLPELKSEQTRLLEGAAIKLRQLGLSDEQIATLRDKETTNLHTEVLAPMTGTVVSRAAYEGQYVKTGDRLFEIGDFSTMWFMFDAYERDLAWIQPGQKVEVTTPSVPGKKFTGKVVFIDPNLKEMTRSAKVRVELPNPIVESGGRTRRELNHRLYAEAVVQVEIPEVLAVSRNAVLSPGGVPVVYVDKGSGAYEQRRVRLGRVGDDAYELLDGLQAGERVVTHGNLLIDSQAQLNANVAQSSAQPAEKAPTLSDAQRQAVQSFLKLADALAAALAADDLNAFNTQAAQSHSVVPELSSAFKEEGPWRDLIKPLDTAGHLSAATDLKSARKTFHPFSVATVTLAQALRRSDSAFGELKVFRCPMTKDAFPDAPRTADWMQLKAGIHNPWFGAEMLDCGSEVKP